MSITDESTRLLNRSAYESFLSENRTEYFAPAACVYIDANGLHEINNTLGHAAGDRMLLSVADGLRKFFPGDKLYRVGGDEFVVFPLKTGQPQCVESMKQLAKELEDKSFSISYGIIYKDTDRGLDNVVLEADNIMLDNKKHYYDSHPRTPR